MVTDRLVKYLRKEEFRLSDIDKNSLLSKNVLTDYDYETISFNFKVIGYKSISNFLANQISPSETKNYKGNLAKFIPIVLPRQLEQVYTDIKFGDKIVFLDKNKHKIEGDFARFSTNNNLCLPKEIRNALDINKLGFYKIIITTKDKTIKIEYKKDE